MQEFLESDTIWSFLLNTVGLISLVVGSWLILKLLAFIINLKKNHKVNAKNYINLLKLPSKFKGQTQIGVQSSIQQNLEFNILLSDESILETIYKGKVDVGEKIFVIDSSKFQNGIYYLSITTSFQKILRKIIVDNL